MVRRHEAAVFPNVHKLLCVVIVALTPKVEAKREQRDDVDDDDHNGDLLRLGRRHNTRVKQAGVFK